MRIAQALLIVALPQVFGLPLPLNARQDLISTLLVLLGLSGSSSSGLGDVTGALSGTSTSGLTSGTTSGLVSRLTGASSREAQRIKTRQNFISSFLGINPGGASTTDLGAHTGAGTTGLTNVSTTELVNRIAGAATSLSSGGTGLVGAPRDTNAIRGLLDSINGSNPVNDLLVPAEGIASVAGRTEGLQFINPLLSGASTLLTLGSTSASGVTSRATPTKTKRQSDGLSNFAALLNPSTLLATLGGIPGLSGLTGLLSRLRSSGSSGS